MISASDYAFLQTMLKTRSGLVLAADKGYLIESRLLPVARQFGCATLGELVARLRTPGAHAEVQSVVEAMTTNESFFFRDKLPFDAFQAVVLPALIQQTSAGQTIRIWCAAASSGQEPYSLAMLLSENPALVAGRRVEIIATDISQPILERAREGIYTQFEVQRGLPVHYLAKYFTKVGDRWQISPQIRRMVTYKFVNLLDNFSDLGRVDKSDPVSDRCDLDEAEEAGGELVVAGRDAARVLELIEEALDPIAQGVGRLVDRTLDPSVGLRGDDGRDASLLEVGADGVAVVALVGEHRGRRRRVLGHQVVVGGHVGGLARRHDEADGEPFRIRSGMNLGREAAARTADSNAMNPPLPPAPC